MQEDKGLPASGLLFIQLIYTGMEYTGAGMERSFIVPGH